LNVHDFEHIQIPEGDMLEGIFTHQQALMEKYHDIERERGALVVDPEQFGKIDNRFVQWRIKTLNADAIEELMEAMNTLKNKRWKVSEVSTDQIHFFEELGDAVHFLVELMITAGMSAKDLARIYHRKAAVNEFRQRSAY
jgi:hypothetical protein